MTLLTETVQISNDEVVGENGYGNDVVERVWTDPLPAWLEQTNSLENDGTGLTGTGGPANQEQTVTTMRLFLELDAPIKHTSLVRWGGEVWTVKGRPGFQPGGFEVPGFRIATIELVGG